MLPGVTLPNVRKSNADHVAATVIDGLRGTVSTECPQRSQSDDLKRAVSVGRNEIPSGGITERY